MYLDSLTYLFLASPVNYWFDHKKSRPNPWSLWWIVDYSSVLYFWPISCWFLFSLYQSSLSTIFPSFRPSWIVTNNKVNSSGAQFVCGCSIFGWYLIKYCGPDVTGIGMSIMIHHCIRHGQTIKVLVMCEACMPESVPDSISSGRYNPPTLPTGSVYIYLRLILHNLSFLPAPPCIPVQLLQILNLCLQSEWGWTQKAWLFRFLVMLCLID